MRSSKRIHNFPDLKILSDARRLRLVQLLMREPATLSQLGQQVGKSAAWVRHHIKVLEVHGIVEQVGSHRAGGFIEKYYRASAQAYLVHQMILPATPSGTVHIVGSDDPALVGFVDALNERRGRPSYHLTPVGSLDGLLALRHGLCELAGCHLYDPVDDSYNAGYVRHLFPSDPVRLFTFAYRQQGLLVAQGNPLGIGGLQDLTRPDVTFINRRRGSGTRLWLDQQLLARGLRPQEIGGYQDQVGTHAAVADAVQSGRADAGIAVLACAVAAGLGYIPLFEERFDLAYLGSGPDDAAAIPLLDALNGARARRLIAGLDGYRTTDTGKEVPLGRAEADG
jgi:molybdate-binding protein/biotin operon repressor